MKRSILVGLGVVLLIILMPTISYSAKPQVVVLANSVDYELASDFFGFLSNKGMETIHITADDFEQFKREKFIVILGGPDAYEGVGEIVQTVLSPEEQEYIRTRGNRKMYTKINVWNQGQVVRVIAGSDRTDTKRSHEVNKEILSREIMEEAENEVVETTPTPTPAPDSGYIYVWSSPAEGSVYVDGNYMGTTSSSYYISIPGETGYHTVEISKNGYEKYSKSVYIYSGQFTLVNAYLTSISTPPLTTEAPTPTPAPNMGYIYIWSSPAGGSIYVDGNYKGTTDSSQYSVISATTGYYTVEVSKEGYKEYSKSVYVYSGQYTIVNAYLIPISTPPPTPPPTPTPTTTPAPTTPPPNITIVNYVIDGDTFVLTNGERVRLIGINTPESGQSCYSEATNKLEELIDGKEVTLETDVSDKDMYGRLLRYVYVDSLFVNLEMVRLGYANAYEYPPDTKYSVQIANAENEAKTNQQGCIWQPSSYSNCFDVVTFNYDASGDDNYNLTDEYFVLNNTCDFSIDMNGWTAKDEAAKTPIYTFPQFNLAPQGSVTVYSGTGIDTSTELYWGRTYGAIWNNDGDTLFLRDASGALVIDYSY